MQLTEALVGVGDGAPELPVERGQLVEHGFAVRAGGDVLAVETVMVMVLSWVVGVERGLRQRLT